MTSILISITLGVTAFLCLLNILFAYAFRKRHLSEVMCYLVVSLVELIIFALALVLRLGILTSVPYHLPPGLPFSRAEIGAALAIGMGLFPAAYWHRNSVSKLRARIEQDGKVMKERESGVYVRGNTPGEWMN